MVPLLPPVAALLRSPPAVCCVDDLAEGCHSILALCKPCEHRHHGVVPRVRRRCLRHGYRHWLSFAFRRLSYCRQLISPVSCVVCIPTVDTIVRWRHYCWLESSPPLELVSMLFPRIFKGVKTKHLVCFVFFSYFFLREKKNLTLLFFHEFLCFFLKICCYPLSLNPTSFRYPPKFQLSMMAAKNNYSLATAMYVQAKNMVLVLQRTLICGN